MPQIDHIGSAKSLPEIEDKDDLAKGSIDHILGSSILSAKVVSVLTESQLLQLLPLIICLSQQPQQPAGLLPSLRKRLLASRKLKLRFLLLQKHPAFASFDIRRLYSSAAYGRAPLIQPRPMSLSLSQIDVADAMPYVTIPVDMVDLQSHEFFSNSIFTMPVSDSSSLPIQLLEHPCVAIHDSSDQFSESSYSTNGQDDELEYDTDVVQAARVRKTGHYKTIELKKMREEEDEIRRGNFELLLPRILVREDEDVLKVHAMQLLFFFFNHIWTRASAKHQDVDSAPICIIFDAVGTGSKRGFIETFRHVIRFNVFNFDFWRDTKAHDPVVVDQFVRSAAGAFTAGYVCGVSMRTGGEMFVKDGSSLFLRQFDGIFSSHSTGPISVPKNMKHCLKELKVWDQFRTSCLRAFHALHDARDEIFPKTAALFSKVGISSEQIQSYINSRHSLNVFGKQPRDALFRHWLG